MTSFPDQWDTLFPLAMTNYPSPVATYHGAGTSKFVGESWDLGAPIAGDWTVLTEITDLASAASAQIERSGDGSTWIAESGPTWRGSSRFVRPVIQTAGAMEIRRPPRISLSALTRTESGEVTTLASGGKLVQLVGAYSGAQDVQATPINTTSARSAVIDRLLLHAQTGLALYFTITGAGNEYLYQKIATPSRVIDALDILQYDVYLDTGNPAPVSLGSNLVTAPDALDNAAWTADGSTVTADATTAPSGATTADLITRTANGRRSQALTVTGAQTYKVAAQIKKNVGSVVRVEANSSGGADAARFNNVEVNVDTGAVSSSSGAHGVAVTSLGSAGGGGWWQVEFYVITAATHTTLTSYAYATQFNTAGSSYWADYNVRLVPEANGGIDVEFGDGTLGRSTPSFVDANGVFGPRPQGTMDVLARGTWYSRSLPLSMFAGKTLNKVLLANDSDADGSHRVLYRNVRITNSSPPPADETFWSSGEPSANVTEISSGASNVRCGPTNSFLLYAFTTSTGAQVASDVRWSFRGL